MFLSIVIPAYNEGNVIKKNLELINKYFTDKFSFEIIVINDGSDDDTNSILYQLKINNLSVYNNLNNSCSYYNSYYKRYSYYHSII